MSTTARIRVFAGATALLIVMVTALGLNTHAGRHASAANQPAIAATAPTASTATQPTLPVGSDDDLGESD